MGNLLPNNKIALATKQTQQAQKVLLTQIENKQKLGVTEKATFWIPCAVLFCVYFCVCNNRAKNKQQKRNLHNEAIIISIKISLCRDFSAVSPMSKPGG